MSITINVGLKTSSRMTSLREESIPHNVALNILRTFCTVREWAVHSSDTEPTLVAVVEVCDKKMLAETMADILCQDCVAIYEQKVGGFLYGEYAYVWGKFNPKYFIRIDGSRLMD